MEPALYSALTAALVAVLLLIQTWAQEKKRRLETEIAREKQADLNATKVVEKLSAKQSVDPDKTALDVSIGERLAVTLDEKKP